MDIARLLFLALASAILLSCGRSPTPEVRTYDPGERAVWSFSLSGDFMNAVAPAVRDGRAYVAAGSLLYALDAATGAVYWQTELGVGRSLGARRVIAGPERVYLNHFETVIAVDRASGEEAWRTAIPDFRGVDLQPMAANATHLLVGGWGEVVRLRRTDGAVDLRVAVPPADTSAPPPRVFGPALAADGTMALPGYTRREGERTAEGSLTLVDSAGARLWHVVTEQRAYPTASGTYTAGGGVHGAHLGTVPGTGEDPSRRVVTYTTGQSVVARDAESGDRIWEAFRREHGFGVGPVQRDTLVVAGTTTGRILGLDARTGEERWHVDVRGGMLAEPVFAGRVVYQIDDGYGTLYAVDRFTGDVLWRAVPPEQREDPDATYRTPPAVASGHLVVVGSQRIYGLQR